MISLCGTTGAISFSGKNTIELTTVMLEALQHRGQEGAGLAWTTGTEVTGFKDFGLIHEVLSKEAIFGISSPISIAHNRYSTTGKADSLLNLQPIVAPHKLSAIAHNGNLDNSEELKKELEKMKVRLYTTSDTELIAALIHHLGEKIIERIKDAILNKLSGAYSVIIVTRTKLIVFRDPYGLRPLSLGRIGKDTWVVASETCAFDNIGAEFIRDIEPGELLVFNLKDKTIKSEIIKQSNKLSLCVFEAIYFARPDSYLKGYQVCQLRQMLGCQLARECGKCYKADTFGAIPNSGIEAAIGFARELDIIRDDIFLADRYRSNRTFIDPDNNVRQRSISKKLHPYKSKIEGKHVAYMDDSIVRGNNTAIINKMLLDIGALSVEPYISAPPIKYPCPYGIDTASFKELIAANLSISEIAEKIYADKVHYLSLNGLDRAIPFSSGICDACFTGTYPTGINKGRFEKELFDKS